MINRRGNTRLEWYDVDLLLWGSITPPPTEDVSKKPWLWDIWGHGPRGQQQQPYLDLGASGLYVRKLWATQIYLQENYTSGVTSGLHGGFHTQVSGLYPASGFNLATKSYVDYMITTISGGGGGGSTSLSGLTDVSGVWSSGMVVSWDGSFFVPAMVSGGGGGVSSSGNWEISGTSAALNAGLPARFLASGLYETSGTSYTKAESNTRFAASGIFGDITGLGTSGTLPVFDANKNLTNSWISQQDFGGAAGIALYDPWTVMNAVIVPDYYRLGSTRIYALPAVNVGFGAFLVGQQTSGIVGRIPVFTEANLIDNSNFLIQGFGADILSGVSFLGVSGTFTKLSVRGQDTDTRYALSGTGGGGGSSTFVGLTDVSGIWTSGQEVSYDGTKFVPFTDTTGSTLAVDNDSLIVSVSVFT